VWHVYVMWGMLCLCLCDMWCVHCILGVCSVLYMLCVYVAHACLGCVIYSMHCACVCVVFGICVLMVCVSMMFVSSAWVWLCTYAV
jgi:hypothetical protein